ncbi:MAG: D-alanyl-lipoteichoic acid biosynthesis protein DltD [Eubacteriales bacterium]|nr:D-alanyl-lipoteichoic acid biosynthesis protein DltD [Eubacteriales bacterium]
MKRVKAFLTALALFLVTVGVIHLFISGNRNYDSSALGVVTKERKAQLNYALTESLGEYSMPVFGSSEFQHGTDTIYHPSQMFAGSDFSPVLIGAGYYQSLGHAVTLASIGDQVEGKKAALILSPQWFRKTGVVDQAYASRFSENNYAKAMENEKLSDETKSYISGRTEELLSVDSKTKERAALYEKVLWKKQGTAWEQRTVSARLSFLSEKEQFETMTLSLSPEYKQNVTKLAETGDTLQEPDWKMLLDQAEEEGAVENQNPFYIDNEVYKKLESFLHLKKDMNKEARKGYQTGPEFQDLECFLKVCRELEIEPLLVLLPVNGYYYDYTGFPKEARQAYYDKIRTLADSYQAQVADFSGEEYTKYFFEDRVHLGKKGWVRINESLYSFYKEN